MEGMENMESSEDFSLHALHVLHGKIPYFDSAWILRMWSRCI